jgi:hypothetical protein
MHGVLFEVLHGMIAGRLGAVLSSRRAAAVRHATPCLVPGGPGALIRTLCPRLNWQYGSSQRSIATAPLQHLGADQLAGLWGGRQAQNRQKTGSPNSRTSTVPILRLAHSLSGHQDAGRVISHFRLQRNQTNNMKYAWLRGSGLWTDDDIVAAPDPLSERQIHGLRDSVLDQRLLRSLTPVSPRSLCMPVRDQGFEYAVFADLPAFRVQRDWWTCSHRRPPIDS